MQKVTLIILLSFSGINLYSQQTFLVTAKTPIKTTGNVYMVLDNTSLVNNGTLQQAAGDGYIKFAGNTDATISGKGTSSIDHLVVDKADNSKINLGNNIAISSSIQFKNGLLNLGNNVIDLGENATLINESEQSRGYTNGNGYIQATTYLNAPSFANPGNLGVTISSSTDLGKTIIKRGHSTNFNGINNSIERYYEIVPANNGNLNAKIGINYFNSELNGINKSALSLFTMADNRWISEGNDIKDNVKNYVEKNGINTLSKFTLFINKGNVSVWPNPVKNDANVRISALHTGTVTLSLFDTKGALLFVEKKQVSVGINDLSLKMDKLPAGTYSLQTNIDNETRIISLIKE